MLQNKPLDFIDLRLTRPPDSLRTKQMVTSKSMDDVHNRANEGPQKSLSDLANEKSVPPKEKPRKERRAMPDQRKLEKEKILYPDGVDIKPRSDVMFGDITKEEMARLRAMITNFCKIEDGSMLNEIDLAQYSKDSGQVPNSKYLCWLFHISERTTLIGMLFNYKLGHHEYCCARAVHYSSKPHKLVND